MLMGEGRHKEIGLYHGSTCFSPLDLGMACISENFSLFICRMGGEDGLHRVLAIGASNVGSFLYFMGGPGSDAEKCEIGIIPPLEIWETGTETLMNWPWCAQPGDGTAGLCIHTRSNYLVKLLLLRQRWGEWSLRGYARQKEALEVVREGSPSKRSVI